MEKSMLNVAYDVVNENGAPISFKDLVNEVTNRIGMNEEELKRRISRFYTNLSLDGRFVTLGENVWDLRSRHPFDRVHIDMNDVYKDDYDDEEHSKDDIEPLLGEETGLGDSLEAAEEDEDGEILKK